MSITLRVPDKRIRLSLAEWQAFMKQINLLSTQGFTGNNNFSYSLPVKEREELYQYHIVCIGEKILNKVMSNFRALSTKKITISFTYAEEQAFLKVCNRVEGSSYYYAIESDVLSQLKPIKAA